MKHCDMTFGSDVDLSPLQSSNVRACGGMYAKQASMQSDGFLTMHCFHTEELIWLIRIGVQPLHYLGGIGDTNPCCGAHLVTRHTNQDILAFRVASLHRDRLGQAWSDSRYD